MLRSSSIFCSLDPQGLGLTLIQYGFTTKTLEVDDAEGAESSSYGNAWWPTHQGTNPAPTGDAIIGRGDEPVLPDDSYVVNVFTTKDWLAFATMTIGMALPPSSNLSHRLTPSFRMVLLTLCRHRFPARQALGKEYQSFRDPTAHVAFTRRHGQGRRS